MSRIAHDGHPNQIAIAHDPVGRVEFYPARAGQIYLHPGVRRAAAHVSSCVGAGNVKVSADKARGQPQRAHRLHHKERVVAATAGAQMERLHGTLHALGVTRCVGKTVALNEPGHRFQHRDRLGRPFWIEEASGPGVNLMVGVRIMAFGGARQIRRFSGRITERVSGGVFLDRTVGLGALEMLDLNLAFDLQSGRRLAEGRYRDRVFEHVVQPPDRGWLRRDRKPGREYSQVVAVARPQHHAMLAKHDRPGVAI